MLKIKQKYHLTLPSIRILPQHMQFAPVRDDDDELTQSIQEDPAVRDDTWQLLERPDTKELTQYWDKVEQDIHHDPEWITIAEDDNSL